MRRATRWSCGVLCVLTLLAGAAWAAEPGDKLPEGQLWMQRPTLPWDEQAVKQGAWAKVLDQRFDITRRGKVGQTRRYRIRRENVMYDKIGHPVNRMLADGEVERTLLKETEPGVWTEQMTWVKFGAQQTQDPREVVTPRDVPGAAGLSYEFAPKTFDYVNIPADFSGIQDPLAGYLMKVVAMDFTGFDALANLARSASAGGLTIGATKLEPRWQNAIDITQTARKETATQYHLNDLMASVAGVTRRGGEPCLLIWFAAEGNDVVTDFSAGPVTMKGHGTEHFWGELAVSLQDGRVVGGELRGPLPWVMEMGLNGEAPKEMPIAGVIQQVSVWEVAAAAK